MAKERGGISDKLLATFRAEAAEHIGEMSSVLDQLQHGEPGNIHHPLIERMFRAAHSLKGASRAVNRRDMEAVCHALEGTLVQVKAGRLAVTRELCDRMRVALDAVAAMREAGAASPLPPPLTMLLRDLENAGERPGRGPVAAPESIAVPADQAYVAAPEAQPAPPPRAVQASVRIAASRLDAMMCEAERLLSARVAAARHVTELREASSLLVAADHRAAASASLARQLGERMDKLARAAERNERTLASITGAVLRQVREMHLLPVSTLLEGFPRTARELARSQSKKVELTIDGGDIEIDRRILQELADPLLHLLRNCVDHGIESPAERERAGKPAYGRIVFGVAHRDGGRIEIAVSDDGAGIRTARVEDAARKLGITAPSAHSTSGDVLSLVFHSGLTTSAMITDISGRGLGLAIVRDKLERLGGSVAVESSPGKGTTFRLLLPHALATYRGVVVQVSGRVFVVPLAAVACVARVPRATLRKVENREVIALHGRATALVALGELLGLHRTPRSQPAAKHLRVLLLGEGDYRIAFEVDAVIGEQEVMVKALGPQLVRVRNVAGACAIADGEVVPVLDVADLLASARALGSSSAEPALADVAEQRQHGILVVEDSITSRALLTSILEAAGYRVTAAVDGVEALAALRAAQFDLVVSDVEMPRMDGFDLTARIRADARLAALPVVLVTALDKREHRERGLDVGANAYIVKSDFEQSNLLDVVARLL